MKKLVITMIITILVISSVIFGYLNFKETSDEPEEIDTDGDGKIDRIDDFPNNPNEWSDLDGDGIGDNSDAFKTDPNEWIDSDGDGIGDNSDVFPDDPNEWSDLDGDGIGDNSDKNPLVDLRFDLKIDKFKVTSKVDLIRWAQIYFEIFINGNILEKIDNNGNNWNVWLYEECIVDYDFSYDIPDQTEDRYTNITVIMYDYDFLKFDNDDIIDISDEPGEKSLILSFDHVDNTISKQDSTQGSQGFLWFDVKAPNKIDPSENVISRTYSWRYDNKNWKLSIEIPIKTYETYSNSRVNRKPQSDSYDAMKSFVTVNERVITDLSNSLDSLAEKEGYNEINTVNFILSFVQYNIIYRSDMQTKKLEEYWRFPIETLVDKTGDCEDSSVLFASIMKSLGYDTVLLFYILEDNFGHLAIGLHIGGNPGTPIPFNGKNYYYCETTTPGNSIGIIPSDIPKNPTKIIGI